MMPRVEIPHLDFSVVKGDNRIPTFLPTRSPLIGNRIL